MQRRLRKAIDALQDEMTTNKLRVRQATIDNDLEELKEFHIQNHLKETARYPGEEATQRSELEDDFAYLYDPSKFAKGLYFVVRATEEETPPTASANVKSDDVSNNNNSASNNDNNNKIVACIGLEKKTKNAADSSCCTSQVRKKEPSCSSPSCSSTQEDDVVHEEDERISTNTIWLQCFSVAMSHRKMGIGRRLFQFALDLSDILVFSTVRLVTLGKHSSSDHDIMGSARRLYERNGFKCYKEEHIDKFGNATSLSVLWYQLNIEANEKKTKKDYKPDSTS